jgi:hypothetical protein
MSYSKREGGLWLIYDADSSGLASNIISNYYLIFLNRNVILSKKKNGNIISGCRENNQLISSHYISI